jgi:transitional endoplasmic reticulum ATPase
MSKYIGESERGVREVFHKARQASPCIIFFDEFESLVPERGMSSDSQVTERVISQFLTELDGLEDLRGILVLAATNRKDLIDSAILRPGRFDLLLDFPLPDEIAREDIFEVHTKGKPLDTDVNLAFLAKETEGMTGSDIERICEEASLAAIRQAIHNEATENEPQAEKITISRIHFEHAIKELRDRKGE